MKKALKNGSNKSSIKIFILVLFSLCHIELAFGMNYAVGVTELISDNIVKSPDKKSGHEETLSLSLAGVFTSSRLSSGADTELRYIRRNEDLFQNSNDIQMVGNVFANMDVIPQRFVWKNSISSDLFLINKRATSNSDNLLNAVSFITQPELIFAISPVDQILLSSAFNYIYNDELFDSQSVSGMFSWNHRLPTGSISLNYTYLGVEYDNSAPGYITGNLFLTYSRVWNQVNAAISLGEISLKRTGDSVTEESSASSANVSLDWRIVATSHLQFLYDRGYYDSFQTLNYLSSLQLENIADDTQVFDSTFTSGEVLSSVSLTDTYLVNWNQEIGVNNFRLQLRRIKRDVEDTQFFQPLTQDDSLFMVISRPINVLTGISFSTEYFEREFGSDITQGVFSHLNFTRRPRKDLFFLLGLTHEDQTSDFPQSNYDALSVFLSVRYVGVI